MISEFTKNAVPQLVGHELEFSKSQHDEKFHSLHKACGRRKMHEYCVPLA